ncbi:MAG: phosphatidate cytidylyltransferase [Fuerstiella sp.]
MLGWRLTVSAILVPCILFLFWWDASLGNGAPVLLVLCLGLSVRAAWEMSCLLKTRALQPTFELVAVCNIGLIFAAWSHVRWQQVLPSDTLALLASLGVIGLTVMVCLLLLMVWQCIRYRKPGHSMESLGADLLTVCYSGGLLALLAQFRWFPTAELGYFAIASVIIPAKAGDIMAYTLGRLFGKRKMVPTLSPGKTWMGGIGALLGSSLGAWLWFVFGLSLFDAGTATVDVASVLLLGMTLGVVGLVGDLAESLIKRDCEKKDSANLMPGFGGLLDLLDSPLFCGPVALIWWLVWPPLA